MVSIFTGLGSGFERGSGATLGGAGLLGSGTLGRSGEQVSLNAATGNLLISQRDEFLVGYGTDASIARTYNSLGDASDENGDNWRQSTDRRIYGTEPFNVIGSTVHRVSADGSDITYTYQTRTIPDGSTVTAYWTSDGSGAFDKLDYANGVWTWTDGDSQDSESYANVYNGQWRITAARPRSGYGLTFGYNGAQLARVTTFRGEYVQYGWDGNNISQVVTGFTDLATNTAKTLTRTRYGYDGANRLTSVTVDLSPEDNAIADGKTYVTTYTYDGTSKRVASIAQTDGSRLDINYDQFGRAITLTQTTLGAPRTTNIAYIPAAAANPDYTTITDSFGQVTRLDYNADRSLAKVTAPLAYAGAAAQISQFGYDGSGNVTSVTDALGAVTVFTYDESGNALTTTDPLGNVVTRTYDRLNNVLTETRTGSDADGAAVSHTTRNAYSGTYLVYSVSAEGLVTRYFYTSDGQISEARRFTEQRYDVSALTPSTSIAFSTLSVWDASITDRSTIMLTKSSFDRRGNIASTKSLGNPTITDGDYSQTDYVYDQSGQLLSRTTSGLNTERFVYDGLGRVIASTDLNGATTNIVFNDAASRTVVTAANGYVQTSTYSVSGELLSSTDSGADVNGGTAYNGYDREGRLRISQDATNRVAYFVYEAVGRKVADVDQYGALTEYRYDANDRVIATIRYQTAITSAQISRLQNLTDNVDLASIRPGSSAMDIVTRSVYDADGRVVEAVSGDGSVTEYRYDGSSRLVATVVYANRLSAAQLAALDAAPATVQLPTPDASRDSIARNFYDKDGRLVGVLDGEGYLARTVYDGAGRSTMQTAFATATAANLRAAGTFAQLLASVGTSGADRTTRSVYDGQGLLRFSIDAQGNVTEFVYKGAADASANGVVRQTIRYAAPIGTLTRYTVATLQTALASQAGATANRASFAVYDTANRPTYTIDATGAVTGFGYDALGRTIKTTQFDNVRATATLPTLAEMAAWQSANSSGNDRVTRSYYAADGNLRYSVDAEGYVSRLDYDPAGRNVATIRWDAAIASDDLTTIDQVASRATGAFVATTSVYDNAGRLVSTVDANNVATAYSWNLNGTQNSIHQAYGTADAVQTLFIYDNAGRVKIRSDAHGTPEHADTIFEYDGLGNVVSTTDPNGNSTIFEYDRDGRTVSSKDALGGITRYQYDAFGAVVKTTDPRGNASYAYYDTLGRVTATRDAEDYVTETSYTTFGEVASITRRANRATNAASETSVPVYAADPAKDATTRFDYDKLGRVKSTTDALDFVESYTLNAFGQRVKVTGKLNGETINAYDRRGLLISETLPINSVTYNGVVQATTVTNRFEYDARSNRTKMIEAAGLSEQRTTRYVYDKLDRLIETHLPAVTNGTGVEMLNPVEYVVYDARGNVIEQRDAANARTLFYYDKLDRQIASIGATGTYSTTAYAFLADTGGKQTSRTYATQLTLPINAGGTPPAAPSGEYRETVATYDKLGRLATSTMNNVRTGSWNGSSYATSVGAVTTRWEYDADGNVVKTLDATGAATFSYYDKLGRKTAQVDEAGYLTDWMLDAEGNALSETRYATATGGATVGARPTSPTSPADRVTTFSYDRAGRRLSETRLGVDYHTVNGASGVLDPVINVGATIRYSYNALGQVLSKIEATGDTTTYTYDSAGRLTLESRARYLNGSGNTILTPTSRYFYDGLGNLVRNVQGDAVLAATDRVTSYEYGAGGRLVTMNDATFTGGNVTAKHIYFYDIVGRKIGEQYYRLTSSGQVNPEGTSYAYDAVGNVVRQASARASDDGFADIGTVSTFTYNAYGEVISRASGDSQVQIEQERNSYDNAGHLWRSTAGDGVYRYYVYDAAGRQTLKLEDNAQPNVSLINRSLEDVLAIASSTGLGVGYNANVNTTVTRYDARGQTILVAQVQRQFSQVNFGATLYRAAGYNAFGELAWQRDDNQGHNVGANASTDAQTDFTYNTLGRLLSTKRFGVLVTNANGISTMQRPTELLFYDISGRLIGQEDANGNRTSRTLLAGTGYGSTDALLLKEFHADAGVVSNVYDVFGDLRQVTDEIERRTDMTYDALGRVTSVSHFGGLVDTYTYDVLGQRIRHTTNIYGAADAETTDYDAQGRITASRAFGGDVTTNTYVLDSSLTTAGLGHYGGTIQTTTYANGRSAIERSDGFGHVISKVDLGGNTTAFTYDTAGRLVESRGIETRQYQYLNTGLAATVAIGVIPDGSWNDPLIVKSHSYYGYDDHGRKTQEITWVDNAIVQNATAAYDALGRMLYWEQDVNTSISPAGRVDYVYDAVGNIRASTAYVGSITDNGSVSGGASRGYWYRYDAMNRLVTRGVLFNGQIVRSTGAAFEPDIGGYDILYDAAGQRMQTLSSKYEGTWLYNYDGDAVFANGTLTTRETYTYDGSGHLAQIRYSAQQLVDDGGGYWHISALPTQGVLKSYYQYNAAGQLYYQADFRVDGDSYATATGYTVPVSALAYYHELHYDSAHRVDREVQISAQNGVSTRSQVTNTYGTGSSYALGAVVRSVSQLLDSADNPVGNKTITDNSYEWRDSALLSWTQLKTTNAAETQILSTASTNYLHDGSGALTSAWINDGRPRTVRFINDALGQALRRDEQDNNAGGDPHEYWIRFDGRELAHVSNNGTLEVSNQASIAQRIAPNAGTGAFRNGASSGSHSIELAQDYDPINSYSQGAGGGTYVARAGDTLASIAAQIWGDASLWYKLAAANGLSGVSGLAAGQTLQVPVGIARSGNSASTFKPYNPNEAYGDLSPTTPQPQAASAGKKGCGVLGQILAAIVAVAVSIVVSLIPVVGPFLAPYAANLASQGVLIATGNQDRINWKSVGQTALRSFLPQGGGIIDTAIIETATQGIEVAVGLRSKIDFAGVAATALATGVANALDAVLPEAGTRLGQFARSLAINTASGLVSAATRSAISGDSFGDSFKAQLPSIVAGTVARFANDLRKPLPGREPPANIKNGAVASGQQAPGVRTAAGNTPTEGEGGGQVGGGYRSAGDFLGLNRYLVAPDEGRDFILASGGLLRNATTTTAPIYEPHYRQDPDGLVRWVDGDPIPPVEPIFVDDLITTASTAISDFFTPIGQFGDGVSSFLTSGSDSVNNAYQSWRDDAYFTPGAGGAALFLDAFVATSHTIANGIAAIPGAVFSPVRSVTNLGYTAASTVDTILRAEDTPAIVHLQRAGASLASATPRQIATGVGNGLGQTALIVGPGKFAPGVKFAGVGRNLGVDAAFARRAAAAESAPIVTDLGLSSGRYSLNGPLLEGFEGTTGTLAGRVGPVRFRAPPGATAEEIAQMKAYVAGSNDALMASALSPTGRVSTKGALRLDASAAAAQERVLAAREGRPYVGQAGHVPDTTWTGNPMPHSWLDLSPRVNSSLGGQAGRYPVGHRPTIFIFE